jgi:hypothetical protein
MDDCAKVFAWVCLIFLWEGFPTIICDDLKAKSGGLVCVLLWVYAHTERMGSNVDTKGNRRVRHEQSR